MRHVQPLAVVLMVHGGFLIMGGCLALAYGVAFKGVLASMPKSMSASDAPMRFMEPMMVSILVGEAAVHLLVGALQGWAGWRMRAYRSRGLAIAALVAGMATVFGCYCLPTSIGLMIWGMIVMLNPAVTQRFASAAWSATEGGS